MNKKTLKVGDLCRRTDDVIILITAIHNNLIYFVKRKNNIFIDGKLQMQYYNDEMKTKSGFGIEQVLKNYTETQFLDLFNKEKTTFEYFNDSANNENYLIKKDFYFKNEITNKIKEKSFIFLRGEDKVYFVYDIFPSSLRLYDGIRFFDYSLLNLDDNFKVKGYRYSGIKCILNSVQSEALSDSFNQLRVRNSDLNNSRFGMIADLRTFKDMGKKRKLWHSTGVYYRNKKEQISILLNEGFNDVIINTKKY